MPSRARRSTPSSRVNPTVIAIVLVVIGATVALGSERLAGGLGAPAATPSAAVLATDPAAAEASTAPDDSFAVDDSAPPEDSPLPSDSPAAPILAAEMPHSVNGTTLTVEADLGSAVLGSDPGSRSFGAAVRTLGATPDKVEIAFAYDEAGSLPLTVLGFRIPGVAPAKVRPLVLTAWLAASAPGVKTTEATVAGVPVTKVTYGDQGAEEYVFDHGDSVFVVESADASLAEAAIRAVPPAK